MVGKKLSYVTFFILCSFVLRSTGNDAKLPRRPPPINTINLSMMQKTLEKSPGVTMASIPDEELRSIEGAQYQGNAFSDDGSRDADFIDEMPNQPAGVDFRQYAGYITVNKKSNQRFFYYLAEGPKANASSLPLILWLSSGPGHSGLGYGAFMQAGPFRVDSDAKTLIKNPHAWNRVANVLFVETPSGVGFSTSENISNDVWHQNDAKSAIDLFIFLNRWFLRFKEYRRNDLYIAAQGYAAGHFAPQLANLFADYNKNRSRTMVNIKGVMMGNPPLDATTDVLGSFHFYWSRGLISDDAYDGFQMDCNPGDPNGFPSCAPYYDILMNSSSNLNTDNFYSPMCPVASISDIDGDNFDTMVFRCNEQYIAGYLNIPSVQMSLHVDTKKDIQRWTPYSWEAADYWKHFEPESHIDQISTMINNGIRVLLYSGDLDLNNPTWGTQLALEKLNMTTQEYLRPWFNTEVEVGGYTAVYKGGLTFAMVRNAGVYIAQYEGLRAITLVRSFLENSTLPKSLYFPFEPSTF